MELLLTNNAARPGEISIVDKETGENIAYSRLDLVVDHMDGPQLRATVTLPISSLPIFNLKHPVEVDADLIVEISGSKYRIVPVAD